MSDMITFNDFAKVEMRVGEIVEAEEVEESDKLVRMRVDFGEEMGERTIFAGIKKWYLPEELVGRRTVFIVNLPSKKMGSFGESQGMILAVDVRDEQGRRAVLLEPDMKVAKGERVF